MKPTCLYTPFFVLLLMCTSAVGRTEVTEAVDGSKRDQSSPLGEGLFEPGLIEEPPREDEPWFHNFLEATPTALTWPATPLSEVFQCLTRAEHDKVTSELSDVPTGLNPIPPRPPLILELNEQFLDAGWLEQGIILPTGAVWRPSLWVFGQFRSALQFQDAIARTRRVADWANRFDLFGQINLTGTERIVAGLRPFDEEAGNRRIFSGYDFHGGSFVDGWNGDFQTLFFEGDFGEIFPYLDLLDQHGLDYGFSVGRMPLSAQQGLLINEDQIDAVTLTKNTISGNGILNLRVTGVYSWSGINRNSPTTRPNDYDPSSQMVALLTESDLYRSTINLDAAYVYGDDLITGDLFAFGASAIQRLHGYHNTYNSSFNVLGSYPVNRITPYADQGTLLFSQLSWTPHHTHDLVYINGFWAIDQFTSPARGPLQGGPLGQTGVLFSGSGVGAFNAPLAIRTNDIVGMSLGYQLYYDDSRQQVVCEVGGYRQTKSTRTAAIGSMVRYQRSIGQRVVGIWDVAITKREGNHVTPNARAELLIKF